MDKNELEILLKATKISKSFGDFVQGMELSKAPDKFIKMEGLPLIPIQIERIEV